MVDGLDLMIPDPARRLLTINETALEFRVGRRALYYWMAHGLIEYVHLANGERRIYADSMTRPDTPIPRFSPP